MFVPLVLSELRAEFAVFSMRRAEKKKSDALAHYLISVFVSSRYYFGDRGTMPWITGCFLLSYSRGD